MKYTFCKDKLHEDLLIIEGWGVAGVKHTITLRYLQNVSMISDPEETFDILILKQRCSEPQSFPISRGRRVNVTKVYRRLQEYLQRTPVPSVYKRRIGNRHIAYVGVQKPQKPKVIDLSDIRGSFFSNGDIVVNEGFVVTKDVARKIAYSTSKEGRKRIVLRVENFGKEMAQWFANVKNIECLEIHGKIGHKALNKLLTSPIECIDLSGANLSTMSYVSIFESTVSRRSDENLGDLFLALPDMYCRSLNLDKLCLKESDEWGVHFMTKTEYADLMERYDEVHE